MAPPAGLLCADGAGQRRRGKERGGVVCVCVRWWGGVVWVGGWVGVGWVGGWGGGVCACGVVCCCVVGGGWVGYTASRWPGSGHPLFARRRRLSGEPEAESRGRSAGEGRGGSRGGAGAGEAGGKRGPGVRDAARAQVAQRLVTHTSRQQLACSQQACSRHLAHPGLGCEAPAAAGQSGRSWGAAPCCTRPGCLPAPAARARARPSRCLRRAGWRCCARSRCC